MPYFSKSFYHTCLLFCLSIFLISCEPIEQFNFPWSNNELTQQIEEEQTFYPVKWVSDGDTFWIDDGSENGKKIRLIGIDAPESVDFGDKTKQ